MHGIPYSVSVEDTPPLGPKGPSLVVPDRLCSPTSREPRPPPGPFGARPGLVD